MGCAPYLDSAVQRFNIFHSMAIRSMSGRRAALGGDLAGWQSIDNAAPPESRA